VGGLFGGYGQEVESLDENIVCRKALQECSVREVGGRVSNAIRIVSQCLIRPSLPYMARKIVIKLQGVPPPKAPPDYLRY